VFGTTNKQEREPPAKFAKQDHALALRNIRIRKL
jgi:hypothetical protein